MSEAIRLAKQERDAMLASEQARRRQNRQQQRQQEPPKQRQEPMERREDVHRAPREAQTQNEPEGENQAAAAESSSNQQNQPENVPLMEKAQTDKYDYQPQPTQEEEEEFVVGVEVSPQGDLTVLSSQQEQDNKNDHPQQQQQTPPMIQEGTGPTEDEEEEQEDEEEQEPVAVGVEVSPQGDLTVLSSQQEEDNKNDHPQQQQQPPMIQEETVPTEEEEEEEEEEAVVQEESDNDQRFHHTPDPAATTNEDTNAPLDQTLKDKELQDAPNNSDQDASGDPVVTYSKQETLHEEMEKQDHVDETPPKDETKHVVPDAGLAAAGEAAFAPDSNVGPSSGGEGSGEDVWVEAGAVDETSSQEAPLAETRDDESHPIPEDTLPKEPVQDQANTEPMTARVAAEEEEDDDDDDATEDSFHDDKEEEEEEPDVDGQVESDPPKVLSTEADTNTDVDAGGPESIKVSVSESTKPEAEQQEQRHEEQKDPTAKEQKQQEASLEAFRRAVLGSEFSSLRRMIQERPELCSQQDQNGWLPLHEASRYGLDKNVAILFQHCRGINVNAKTAFGKGATALWWAIKEGYDNESGIVKLLKSVGGQALGPSDPDPAQPPKTFPEQKVKENKEVDKEEEARPVVSFVADDIRMAAYLGDNNRIEDYLTLRPDWINDADENGWTAVHEAVRQAHVGTIRLLAQRGADLNARTGDGWSPLAMARDVHGPDHPTARALEELGAIRLRPQ